VILRDEVVMEINRPGHYSIMHLRAYVVKDILYHRRMLVGPARPK
jgi:hypothetical protein